MASRRTRIKGIANIPQRRKNVVAEEKCNESDNLNLPNLLDEGEEIVKQPLSEPVRVNNNEAVSDSSQSNSELGNIIQEPHSIIPCDKNNSITNEDESKPAENQISTDAESNIVPETPPQQPPLKRRTFLKPLVSVSAINRKPRHNLEKDQTETSIEKEATETDKTEIKNNNTQQEATDLNLKDKQIASKGVSKIGCEVTLDEVHLTSQNGLSDQDVQSDKGVKKVLPHASNAPSSDNEYPPPPPSPSKINRSRIKAIPRLSYRKTSFSASESEDESKRNYNRNRNDSVCSTASGIPESIMDCFSPQRPKDFNSVTQKKCNRTDQSRKLAEARREFQRRFGTNTPDRQKLTMMDLIFYNPTSNPMTVMKSKQETDEAEEIEGENENIDDPQQEKDTAGKSDEENEMPVPQIKIGPTGEIIVDEKSLVIENKEVKKQREELQKTKLVDGDFDTGYGIYKRQKRAKEWSHSETLRFYKALNTIGTDFTLMCDLFPMRTRRELKQKFKKEEKINRSLIDKAVMQPRSFDYNELKHEVDMEQKELEELERQKEEENRMKQEKTELRLAKKRKATEKAEMEQNTQKSIPEAPTAPKPPKIRKVRKPRQKKLNIESVLEDSDADVSDIATQSESEGEEEITTSLKPTRSGRIPKATRKFDTTETYSVENIMKKNKVQNVEPNIEPGSIMIITEAGPNGEPVHKIYMVTNDNNATPLELNSEQVSKAIQFKKGMAAQNILTISATNRSEREKTPAEDNTTEVDQNITESNNTFNENSEVIEVAAPADSKMNGTEIHG